MSEPLAPPPAPEPRQSPTQHRILPAIHAARLAFLAVERDATAVPDDGRRTYRYATLAAHLRAVDGALLNAGVFLEQDILQLAGGARLVTRLVHAESAEWRAGWLPLPQMPRDVRDYGAMLTYCRRYGLAMLLGLAPEDEAEPGTRAGQPTTWRDHGEFPERDGRQDEPRDAPLSPEIAREFPEAAPQPESPPPPPEPPAKPASVNGVVKALIAAAKVADGDEPGARLRTWEAHGTFLRSLSSATLEAVGDRWRAAFGEDAPPLPAEAGNA